MSSAEASAHTTGTILGMLAGAKIGTTMFPVPVVGTFIGAVVGGMLGAEMAKGVAAPFRAVGTASRSVIAQLAAPS